MTEEPGLSNEEIVEALRQGPKQASDAAMKALVDRYGGKVYARCRRDLEHEDALDVTQAVFIRAWQHIDQLNKPESLGGWLYRIAERTTLNHLQRVVNKPTTKTPRVWEADGRYQFTPPRIAIGREELAMVRAAIEQLPSPKREMMRLRDQDREYEEIADILDIPAGTVKRKIHEARGELAQETGVDMPPKKPSKGQDEVMKLVGKKMSIQEIAAQLNISERAVADRINRYKKKLR